MVTSLARWLELSRRSEWAAEPEWRSPSLVIAEADEPEELRMEASCGSGSHVLLAPPAAATQLRTSLK